MGENLSTLGEDFSLTFFPKQGFQGSHMKSEIKKNLSITVKFIFWFHKWFGLSKHYHLTPQAIPAYRDGFWLFLCKY